MNESKENVKIDRADRAEPPPHAICLTTKLLYTNWNENDIYQLKLPYQTHSLDDDKGFTFACVD